MSALVPSEQTPVLIVGGGPVGLALSIDLSWRNVSHILIERDPRAARATHPRMDQVGVRSMEHFRRLGMVDAIEAAGFPRDMRRDVVFATGVLGYELAREPFEADAHRAPPAFSPQKHELCPQNFLDPVLQQAAERSAIGDIRYHTRLLDIADLGDCVRCTVEANGGRHYSIQAQYLAGCDGSGGAVAERLAVGAAAATTLANSTNIFIRAPALRARAGGPGAYRYILIGPQGAWASMVNIDGRDIWRLQVLGDAERPTWTAQDARVAIDLSIGGATGGATGDEIAYELVSIVPWSRRELIVDQFSIGRSFLLGDAAHQFSPTGGYGMNTGLSEAFNLAWKLAATLEGWGGPALLSSYQVERRPVAIRNAQRATVNFHRMRSLPGDALIDDPAPAADLVRQHVGEAIRLAMQEEWESMGVHLGYSYAGSPVICDDGPPGHHSDPVDFQQTACPGARAPHVWLDGGRSTLDLFGRGFVLLQFGPDEGGSASAMLEAAARQGVPLRFERIDHARAAALYERRFVLVRPDGHVAMRGDEIGDPAAIIAQVRGAAPLHAAFGGLRATADFGS